MNELFEWLSQRGWLGTRAPRAADIVVAALALLVPTFWAAARLARRRPRTHAAAMTLLYLLLAAVVFVFVLWARAHAPAAPRLAAAWFYAGGYLPLLTLHVVSAIGALALGAAALGWAARFGRGEDGSPGFADPQRAVVHRRLGRAFLWSLTAAALTGGCVYLLRYVY